MARLFIAVRPTADVSELLLGITRKDRPAIRWVPPERWHVTLAFLGDADPLEVAARLDAATLPAARARYGPGIDVMFDRVLAVPVHGLDDLAHEVVRATRGLGSERPPKRFTGHLTLARLGRRGWIPAVIGTPFVAEHPVDEIELVSSTLRPAGAVHDALAAWPVPPADTEPGP